MSTNQNIQTDPGARARVIKLGLDVHASLIVVVRQVDEQASQPPQRFSEDGFIGFIHRQLAQADAVHSCWRLLRNQPDYHSVAKWREAFVTGSPARRKKIVVAIARQLAIDLWRLATNRATAEQLG